MWEVRLLYNFPINRMKHKMHALKSYFLPWSSCPSWGQAEGRRDIRTESCLGVGGETAPSCPPRQGIRPCGPCWLVRDPEHSFWEPFVEHGESKADLANSKQKMTKGRFHIWVLSAGKSCIKLSSALQTWLPRQAALQFGDYSASRRKEKVFCLDAGGNVGDWSSFF